MVGLLPLAAVDTIEFDPKMLGSTDFIDRVQWFLDNRQDLTQSDNVHIELSKTEGGCARIHLALVGPDRLRRLLHRMLDPSEFRSSYGIRSLSKVYEDNPYEFPLTLRGRGGNWIRPQVRYCPAESDSGMFGGNSNWRGPVWMPVNVVLIEALRRHHEHLGSSWTVFAPPPRGGVGKQISLSSLADELVSDLYSIFSLDGHSRRPVFGGAERYQADPQWRDLVLFYEYFHGDNGAGIGASHQTGWSGQIANIILGL